MEEKFDDLMEKSTEDIIGVKEERKHPNWDNMFVLDEERDIELVRGWKKEARKIEDIDGLKKFIEHLMNNYRHDYGTIVHAMTAVMLASMRVVDKDEHQGGITGFQASCVAWDVFREVLHIEGPVRMLKFENMLYPQYEDVFSKTISEGTWEWLKKEAAKKLVGSHISLHPDVMSHLQSIVEGNVPFGFIVTNDKNEKVETKVKKKSERKLTHKNH